MALVAPTVMGQPVAPSAVTFSVFKYGAWYRGKPYERKLTLSLDGVCTSDPKHPERQTNSWAWNEVLGFTVDTVNGHLVSIMLRQAPPFSGVEELRVQLSNSDELNDLSRFFDAQLRPAADPATPMLEAARLRRQSALLEEDIMSSAVAAARRLGEAERIAAVDAAVAKARRAWEADAASQQALQTGAATFHAEARLAEAKRDQQVALEAARGEAAGARAAAAAAKAKAAALEESCEAMAAARDEALAKCSAEMVAREAAVARVVELGRSQGDVALLLDNRLGAALSLLGARTSRAHWAPVLRACFSALQRHMFENKCTRLEAEVAQMRAAVQEAQDAASRPVLILMPDDGVEEASARSTIDAAAAATSFEAAVHSPVSRPIVAAARAVSSPLETTADSSEAPAVASKRRSSLFSGLLKVFEVAEQDNRHGAHAEPAPARRISAPTSTAWASVSPAELDDADEPEGDNEAREVSPVRSSELSAFTGSTPQQMRLGRLRRGLRFSREACIASTECTERQLSSVRGSLSPQGFHSVPSPPLPHSTPPRSSSTPPARPPPPSAPPTRLPRRAPPSPPPRRKSSLSPRRSSGWRSKAGQAQAQAQVQGKMVLVV